jgi:hypothetical protein
MAENSGKATMDKMTVKELRDMAKEIPGLTGFSTMKKAELLAKINEAQGKPAAKPKKKHVAVKKPGKSMKLMTVQEIKNKILQLREQKVVAQKNGDKNHINAIRRKISRLKKMSRKV